MAKRFTHLKEIGPGFWNLRGSFTVALGMADIGTHMSFLRLSSGKMLVIDTCDVNPAIKIEIDELTDNGRLIQGVVGTHPFHTMFFSPFYKLYPNTKYYGTPRHLRNNKFIPWAGDLNDETVRNMWENDGVSIRIPDGADFVNPAEDNHFISAFVFHKESRTIHVDDTVNCFENPGFLMRMMGIRDGTMDFHNSTLKGGLLPTSEAPLQFRDWVSNLLKDWDFDNICSAHNGNKIGGAKEQLAQLLSSYEPKFQKLSQGRAKPQCGGK
jgi:hypothetical protein